MSDKSLPELSFQPPVKAYSFKSSTTVAPETKEGKLSKFNEAKSRPAWINPLLLLALEIFGLTIIFIIFLLILNFFKIISLNNFLPNQIAQSTIVSYNSKTNLWTAKGTLYGYNKYIIKIKINNQITDFKWPNDAQQALVYESAQDLNDSNFAPAIYTLFDLEQDQNLGKKVNVSYEVKNGVNIINSLSIFKL